MGYQDKTKQELQQEAQSRGIQVGSDATKDEIAQALEENDQQQQQGQARQDPPGR